MYHSFRKQSLELDEVRATYPVKWWSPLEHRSYRDDVWPELGRGGDDGAEMGRGGDDGDSMVPIVHGSGTNVVGGPDTQSFQISAKVSCSVPTSR